MSANVVWKRLLSFFPEVVKGNSGATPAVDFSQGSVQSLTLNAATVTPTFVNPPGGANLALVLTQDGTGGRTVTWPAAVTWIGGNAPILLSGAGQTTLVYFYFDGTTFWGSLASGASPSSIIPWTTVAAGTALAASLAKPNLACDTSGTQSTITLPSAAAMANSDGFEFAIKCTGNMVSPVIMTGGAGTTVELLNAPGTFGASTWMPIQGQGVVFKYDKSTTTWKARANTEGSGAVGSDSYNPGWYAETDIYIDRVSGVDSNSGAVVGSPIRTKAEAKRRFGTWSPDLATFFRTIHYLSADVDGSDPGLFTPNFINGGGLIHTMPLPAPSFTGTLLAVTAKNVVAKQALSTTFTTTTGAIAANMLLVNTTRGNSRALVQRNTAGATWQLSQPLVPYVPGTLQFPAEVDTWTNGDAIVGYTLGTIALERIGGTLSQYTAPFAPAHEVVQMAIFSNGGFSATQLDFDCYPIVADVVFQGALATAPSSGLPGAYGNIWGCAILGQLQLNNVQNESRMVGGFASGGGLSHGLTCDCDAILAAAFTSSDFQGLANGGATTSAFLDTGAVLTVSGNSLLPTGAKIGGPGTYNQQDGTTTYIDTAVATFPVNALKLNGATTGYSYLTTAGLVAIHQLALSAGNLDAAAGAAGFGGFAFGGGGTFSKNGAAP